MSASSFSFLFGTNADFIGELYERYLSEPTSVDPSWQVFFSELRDDARAVTSELRGASWNKGPKAKVIGVKVDMPAPAKGKGDGKAAPVPAAAANEDAHVVARNSVRALMLIRAHRAVGHMMATLDPLGIKKPALLQECDPTFWGFSEEDMDKPIFIDGVLGLQSATLRQILQVCRATYCQSIGYEFLHVQNHDQKQWLQSRIEGTTPAFTKNDKRTILEQLTRGESFEKFLAVKFPGTKRFGLEGGEALIPAINVILQRAAELNVKEAVFGMAHRGRLNVLTNILGKSFTAMFAEFQGTPAYPESVQGSGDVKYHMGLSTDRDFNGKSLHLTLSPNPSHLEFVNPVVLGRVRAKQQQYAGKTFDLEGSDFDSVVGILMHGDAAFAGQGVVAETMELMELKGYRTGGTIHIVINNQVGFTTNPEYSKSSHYCSDIAKKVEAPIFHVNGDDPEAVAHVSKLAIEFRQQFKRDVVLDIVCYRRQGHNEGDEPAFTQPKMYKTIRALTTTRELYAQKLNAEGSLSKQETDAIQKDFTDRLEKDFAASSTYKPNKAEWLEGKWAGLEVASGEDRSGNTAVDVDTLKEIVRTAVNVPKGFEVNPKVSKVYEQRVQAVAETGKDIDWGCAEALAFGSLVLEGTPVRLSGQDCGRGTFSQRHSVLIHQGTEERYVPLNNIRVGRQASYEVIDSPLSETSVLGYEYGYSIAEPHALVMWEGQFGDFANGAQVIIDQFIASSETKWLRMSGLVLLLPHGYEGQGPEHSSARLERFLQLSAEDNWQVANCTTPANYFHILRRQIRRPFRKPLVLMTPKSLLRHKMAVSNIGDFGPGTRFQRVIDETSKDVDARKCRRVVLCSGKLYYDLLAERDARKANDVAIVRVEELYPFPAKPLAEILKNYAKAEVVWAQEEPQNMGAWHYIDRRIEGVLQGLGRKDRPSYVGRVDAASPATGYLKRHNKEQAELIDKALAK